MHQLNADVHYPLDLVGIFAFALSGCLLAIRKDFGIFGTVVLGEITGLGGGLFRDTVLGVPPVAFTDLGYALAPMVAAALAYTSHAAQRNPMVCEVLDAAAVALFSVTGTLKALHHGFAPLPSCALGIATAAAGGAVSSVLTREIPAVLRWDQDLAAAPAVAGAVGVTALHAAGMLSLTTALGTGIAAFALRLLTLRYHWRSPRSLMWRAAPGTGPALAPDSAWVPGTHREPGPVWVPGTDREPGPTRAPDPALPGVRTAAGASAPPRPPGLRDPEPPLRICLPRTARPRQVHGNPGLPLSDNTVQLRLPAPDGTARPR